MTSPENTTDTSVVLTPETEQLVQRLKAHGFLYRIHYLSVDNPFPEWRNQWEAEFEWPGRQCWVWRHAPSADEATRLAAEAAWRSSGLWLTKPAAKDAGDVIGEVSTTPQQSPQEMLENLRKAIAPHKAGIEQAKRSIAQSEAISGLMTTEWVTREVEQWQNVLLQNESIVAALEQAVATLEVLTHPEVSFVEASIQRSDGPRRCSLTIWTFGGDPGGICSTDGPALVGTILQAHKALYTAPREKGETHQ